MDKEYSLEKLRNFLDYAAEKGLINKHTAQSRKQAATKILSVLDESEQKDLRQIDREEVFQRFSNLNSSSFKPSSLKVYQSRLSTALDDFIEWTDDPASFKPSKGRATKKNDRNGNENENGSVKRSGATTGTRGAVGQHGLGGTENQDTANRKSTMSIPIPLRADFIVECSGLPTDLTKSEANKISAVIQAYATTEEKE